MTQLREFLQEVVPDKQKRYDFRSKEVKSRVKEVNQETDGIERHEADCFAGLLCGNGEGADDDTLEPSL